MIPILLALEPYKQHCGLFVAVPFIGHDRSFHLDVTVMVKPGTSETVRRKIRRSLRTVLNAFVLFHTWESMPDRSIIIPPALYLNVRLRTERRAQ